MNDINTGASPAHIAIIMDGNGRWAKNRGMLRHVGHKAGLDTARKIIERCATLGVGTLTLFTFSSENWHRPEGEVSRLMELFMVALGKDVRELHANGIRVRFIGKREPFSGKLQQGMREAEELTRANRRMLLNIAVSYGGRWDIVEAARRFAAEVARGAASPADMNENSFAAGLSLGGFPDPDLFIRTGGERRLSNFMLWNLAYSELYFSDLLWPDFGEQALDEALQWFNSRRRRFGRTQEQAEGGRDA